MYLSGFGKRKSGFYLKRRQYTLIAVCCIVFATRTLSQTLTPLPEFGTFEDAASFCSDRSNEFYIIDRQTSKILKIDSLGNMLKEGGGFGWENGLFDSPCCVFATPFRLLIADKNNHRIQISLRDLSIFENYLPPVIEGGEKFRYPAGIVQNQQGDNFVIDSENRRILKYSYSGEYLLQFGGVSYGNFSLAKPKKIKLTGNESVAVLDENRIVFFDYFGKGLSEISPDVHILDIAFSRGIMYALSENKLYALNKEMKLIEISVLPENITGKPREISVSDGRLYLLTSRTIYAYTIE